MTRLESDAVTILLPSLEKSIELIFDESANWVFQHQLLALSNKATNKKIKQNTLNSLIIFLNDQIVK